MKRIPFFTPGLHIDSKGYRGKFTPEQLADAAASYNPKLHEAQLVIGHLDKSTTPSFGAVGSLEFSEGLLAARPSRVDPRLTEMYDAGHFTKVSGSFYLPDAPNNPNPGHLTLRHIGFLGGMPPAIKGLPAVEFAEAEEGVVEFNDGYELGAIARVFSNLRDWFVETLGLEKADQVIPSWTLDGLKSAAAAEASEGDDAPSASFAEAATDANATDTGPEQQPPTQAAGAPPIATLEASRVEAPGAEADPNPPTGTANAPTTEPAAAPAQSQPPAPATPPVGGAEAEAARLADLAAREQRLAHQEHVSFCEQLVQDGRLLPVEAAGVVALLDSLPDAGTVEFAEGGATRSVSTRQWMQDFLRRQPVHVDFSEFGRNDRAAGVDLQDPNEVAKAIGRYIAEHPRASYPEAAAAVCRNGRA